MLIDRRKLLCLYRYDPLDRLSACAPSTGASALRFYLKDRFVTEAQAAVQSSTVQHGDYLLAQQKRDNGKVENCLFATDQHRSVLGMLNRAQPDLLVYTPYGHPTAGKGLFDMLGFNGERSEAETGHYILGNGYRAFNPVLMRFNSPDSWSPFGNGGLNAYAYCSGDPVNYVDAMGHSRYRFIRAGKEFATSANKTKTGRVTRPKNQQYKSMTNIRPLRSDVFMFDDRLRNEGRLNIMAHGTDERINGNFMMHSQDGNLSPKGLFSLLSESDINLNQYKTARLLMCNSANGGINSFASKFSNLVGKSVKGYKNALYTSPASDSFQAAFEAKHKSIRQVSRDAYTYDKGMRIKKKSSDTDTENTFNYESVTYTPIRSQQQ